MSYENREIPEGINVSRQHPLKEFAWLLAAAAGLIVVAILVLSYLAEYLVRYIPFETEYRLAAAVERRYPELNTLNEQDTRIQHYLQSLADRLVKHQRLPGNMRITVHYVDNELVNAFATLGGHVVIFSGLLHKVPHENALSMVMAHEIAHIKHRDPIVSIGRGLTVFLALSSLAGFSHQSVYEQFLDQAGLLTTLSFSRQQETEADQEAFATLLRQYGHLRGGADLFELLRREGADQDAPMLFRSHPMTEDRIQAMHRFGTETRPESARPTPLPRWIRPQEKD